MMRAFFVKGPRCIEPSVVVAESASKARYHLYRHFKELGAHMLRSGCGLRTYNVTHFDVRRVKAFDPLAAKATRARSWNILYAEAELKP